MNDALPIAQVSATQWRERCAIWFGFFWKLSHKVTKSQSLFRTGDFPSCLCVFVRDVFPCFRSALICLLFAGAAAANPALMRGLYADRQWAACRTEARRVLLAAPENYEARLFLGLAQARLESPEALPALRSLAADPAAPPALRWPARYAEALLLWRQGDGDGAAAALREVFLHTADRDLFLKSGCALMLAWRAPPIPGSDLDNLAAQLQTAAPQWTPALIQTVRREMADPPRAGFQPGRYGIAFYRAQIRPAIGDRCVLTPSCSEYSRQAFKTHGFFMGIAMTTDRFIREPGVVAAAAHPVACNGRMHFADPLSDHDWWFAAPDNADQERE